MSAPSASANSHSIWSLVTGSKAHERPALALSFIYFFCVLSAYYMLRPLRDQFSSAVGSTNLWQFWVGTFLATLALAPVFGTLVKRYPREKFIPIVYGFFILCLVLFVPAFAAQEQIGARLLGTIFYIWLSVFSLFVVSVFWSFMADIFDMDQAKRLFPVIALGGTTGAILGPLIARLLPIQTLLFGAVGLLSVAVAIVMLLSRWSQRHPNPQRRAELAQGAVIGGDIMAGLKQVFRSRFLGKMALLMLLADAVGTVAYALGADWIGAHYADREARKNAWATIDLTTNILQMLMQATLTRFLMLRVGAAGTILTSAALSVSMLVLTAIIGPGVMIIATLIVTRAGGYGIHKPASDSLYARIDREARYKGKNFIETTVWRFGDVMVSSAMAILTPLGIGVAGFAMMSASASALSGWFGWHAAHSPELAREKQE